MTAVMGHTLVAFHAHPDDEALTTGGTLAKAAGAGHRVVLVTATDGAVGLASTRYAGTLAATRPPSCSRALACWAWLGSSCWATPTAAWTSSPGRPAGSGVFRSGLGVRGGRATG